MFPHLRHRKPLFIPSSHFAIHDLSYLISSNTVIYTLSHRYLLVQILSYHRLKQHSVSHILSYCHSIQHLQFKSCRTIVFKKYIFICALPLRHLQQHTFEVSYTFEMFHTFEVSHIFEVSSTFEVSPTFEMFYL